MLHLSYNKSTFLSRLEVLSLRLLGGVRWARVKCRVLSLSPGRAHFPRGHEVLELLRAEDKRLYVVFESSRL